jgi:sec-independent protein translocase protein TatA
MNDYCPLISCPSFAFLGDVGGGELLVILAAILVLFGGKGLPGMARKLGEITRDLQRATQDFKNQLLTADNPEDSLPAKGKNETLPAPDPLPGTTPPPPKEPTPRDPAG